MTCGATRKISLRQLADQAGVSNPYLSQIERGLRKPSAEVLAAARQRAAGLHAGDVPAGRPARRRRTGQGVLAAIAADPELTLAQKQSLTPDLRDVPPGERPHAEAEAAASAETAAATPRRRRR